MSKRILLADDSVTIQKIVELTFEGEGFDLDVVADGNEAFKQAEASQPDIVLADLTMPGLSGIELCRKIREHPDLKDVPVILLTNSFEEFNRTDGDEAGINAYVEKPFESQSLIDQVRELLSEEAPSAAEDPKEEELQPPADEVDLISDEPEEAIIIDDVLEDEVEEPAAAAVEHAEDLSLVDEVSEEPEAADLVAEEVVEEAPVAEERVIDEEPEPPALEAEEVAEEAAVGEELEAPVFEAEEAAEEMPEAATSEEIKESEELYEPEIEPASQAFASMMDSTIEALGPSFAEEGERREEAEAAAAAAGAVLEETIGDAVRTYIDKLINQAVEQLAPTITDRVAERLEKSFPPIAERIIREEIEKLKRGE